MAAKDRAIRQACGAILVALLVCPVGSLARGVYQDPIEFVRETYDGRSPPARMLWLTDALQREVAQILGHPYPSLRLRYWLEDRRSAWVLEEIGKEQPITVGIVIDAGHIERVRILVFRESRGDEVRHDFFTDQFRNASLRPDARLDQPIDGISGASLSVAAVTELARLALYLHEQVVR